MSRGLDRFLNTISSDGDVPIVDTANPVRWSKLGLTLITSFIASVFIGWQRVLQAAVGGLEDIIMGVTGFFTGTGALQLSTDITELEIARSQGFILFLASEFDRFVSQLWDVALTGVPGFLQLPVAISALLATFWIVSQAIAFAREEVL